MKEKVTYTRLKPEKCHLTCQANMLYSLGGCRCDSVLGEIILMCRAVFREVVGLKSLMAFGSHERHFLYDIKEKFSYGTIIHVNTTVGCLLKYITSLFGINFDNLLDQGWQTFSD
jgi:hypothetical protein